MISGPVAYIYFYIVQREKKAPSNLPAVLIHILERKDEKDESENESGSGREECHASLRKTYTVNTVFILLPATFPLGKLFNLIT